MKTVERKTKLEEVVLVYWDCHNKVAQSGWFKQQTCTLLQLWRLGVQNQSGSGLVSSEATVLALQIAYLLSVMFLCVFLFLFL